MEMIVCMSHSTWNEANGTNEWTQTIHRIAQWTSYTAIAHPLADSYTHNRTWTTHLYENQLISDDDFDLIFMHTCPYIECGSRVQRINCISTQKERNDNKVSSSMVNWLNGYIVWRCVMPLVVRRWWWWRYWLNEYNAHNSTTTQMYRVYVMNGLLFSQFFFRIPILILRFMFWFDVWVELEVQSISSNWYLCTSTLLVTFQFLLSVGEAMDVDDQPIANTQTLIITIMN